MTAILSRPVAALLLLALYALMCAAVWWRHRRRQQLAAAESAALLPAADAGPPVLVLHASQTGQAEELAWQTAKALHLAGMPVRVAALGEIDAQALKDARHALFIASTYGEGDAPDSAAPFARDLMAAGDGDGEAAPIDLSALQVGVLALGDATYTHFCGFGRALDTWLRERGAQSMFDRIEADRSDPAALATWRQHLSHFAGTADLAEWEAPVFSPWRLRVRRHLNPGSQGGPVFHLALTPADGSPLPDWEAGDLVQVLPAANANADADASGDGDADASRPREYTICSLPADGAVELMVRRTSREDGAPGRASGLLTEQLALEGTVALRLRAHASFRIGANAARPLILIGNGTGLAGLRAHLKSRAQTRMNTANADNVSPAPAWLLFGERQSAHDAHYRDEIDTWQRDGLIAHADWAFSRDQDERIHVQHLLARHAQRLREWVADGAALYVCGSLQGMAGAVDAVLRETLGEAEVDALIRDGRYRRDVY